MTDASFRAQVIATVAQIQNIYWDLVNAYEDLKVKQTALQFAQRTLTDNKKQVEIGTLAPIEVVSAQSSVATATQNLITSQTNLQYQQLITKNAIARNFNDPQLTAAEVIPTDTMILSNEPQPPAEELVSYALANRPELLESELNLRNNEINIRGRKKCAAADSGPGWLLRQRRAGKQLRRRLHPTGEPEHSGQGRICLADSAAAQSGGPGEPDPLRAGTPAEPVELPAAEEPDQPAGPQRGICLATGARGGGFGSRGPRLRPAEPGCRQKKYALGASTSYLVLQQQSNETQAASNYVAALSTYEKARVALDQVTATILDRNGISMEDAVSGQVTHMPSVPGLQPNPTPSTVTVQPTSK